MRPDEKSSPWENTLLLDLPPELRAWINQEAIRQNITFEEALIVLLHELFPDHNE